MYMHQPERNRALLLLAAQANDTFNLQLACVTALAEEEEEERKREEERWHCVIMCIVSKLFTHIKPEECQFKVVESPMALS